MAILKCKMCGGNLEVIEGQNYATCDSCGSTMTLPKVNDERIVNLFNRATHYRQQNEFDKALATYESILEEDNENAEAHWGCVLSRYGIEYVEDTRTHDRIPTCHRVQNDSILADLDYKEAIKYAPVLTDLFCNLDLPSGQTQLLFHVLSPVLKSCLRQ